MGTYRIVRHIKGLQGSSKRRKQEKKDNEERKGRVGILFFVYVSLFPFRFFSYHNWLKETKDKGEREG